MKLWKTNKTFTNFEEADNHRNALIEDGKDAKIRRRYKKGTFDVVVCVKVVEDKEE